MRKAELMSSFKVLMAEDDPDGTFLTDQSFR
jgi:hypothetical protein